MDYLKKIIYAIEALSLEDIKDCFDHGISANLSYNGKPLIDEVISNYARGPQFKKVIHLFINYGLIFNDKILLAVLADDHLLLDQLLKEKPNASFKKYSFKSAFAPIHEASLLHLCAEYNHVACAKILINHGVSVNVKAGEDENGFGGQTAVFHAVNQHKDNGLDVLPYLIAQGADLHVTLKGIVWGRDYPWETFIPSVNPISYGMMGLLPQFQRKEKDIYETIALLMQAAYQIDYHPKNIPNHYLYPPKP